MKLSQLRLANQAVDQRAQLLGQIAALDGLVVALSGRTMDKDFAALARPHVERELRARVAECDRDLRALGIVID